MGKEKRKSNEPRSGMSKGKVWGLRFMLLGVILNGAVLLIDLRVSNLEGQLAERRRRLQDFMTNHHVVYFETVKQTLFTSSLNQLKMLRALSKQYLSANDYTALAQTETLLTDDIDFSTRKIIGMTYQQGRNLSEETDLNKMFYEPSLDSLEKAFPVYKEEEWENLNKLMAEMNQFDRNTSFWKNIFSYVTILSMIAVVTGSIFLFKVGEPVNADIPKTN